MVTSHLGAPTTQCTNPTPNAGQTERIMPVHQRSECHCENDNQCDLKQLYSPNTHGVGDGRAQLITTTSVTWPMHASNSNASARQAEFGGVLIGAKERVA